MGRKRIGQLLEQLETNQEQELLNAAAIFTVAQVAVNKLSEQISEEAVPVPAILPSASTLWNKANLLERYSSHVGCRRAAKERGIKFSKNPTWEQLVAAFNYAENLQELVKEYLKTHPAPNLHGVSFQVKL